MKKLFTLFAALVVSLAASATADAEWNFSDDAWQSLTYSADTTYNGLTIHASSDKTVIIESNSKTFDGVSYTKRLKFGGTGSTSGRTVSFDVTGSCAIYVAAVSSNTSDDRILNGSTLSDDSFSVFDTMTASCSSNSSDTLYYSGDATTIYLYSASSGLNLYDIQVFYTSSDSSDDGDDTDDTGDGDDTGDTGDGDDTDDTDDTDGSYAESDTLLTYTITAADTLSSHAQTYLSAGPGTIYLGASGKVESSSITESGYAYKLDGNNASSNTKYVLLTLASGTTFQAGDTIKIGTYATSAPSASNAYGEGIYTELGGTVVDSIILSAKNTLETWTYVVPSGSTLVGLSAIYVQRNYAKSVYFYQATIIRASASTTITRNTSTGGWATFSSTSNATVPDGVKVYTGAVNEAGDSILLTAVDISSSQVLPANTGFLLKGEGSSTIELTTTTETSTVEVDSSNELVPTGDSGYTAPDNNSTVYGLFSDNLFYLITGGTTMPANGAYIVINTSSESIAMGIIDDTTEDDSDTTGISSVETAVKQDGVFYNLQGVRVTNPTQGLYIVNGKKVVIK